jgi:hypothetical protein
MKKARRNQRSRLGHDQDITERAGGYAGMTTEMSRPPAGLLRAVTVALSVLLTAVTVWLVRRRAT